MKHVMLDLETMGLGSDALILSIGAVEFDPTLGLGREFYQVVKQDDQLVRWNRTADDETIRWWAQQSDEARKIFSDPSAVPLDIALNRFQEWYGVLGTPVWGNGADFDNVVLANAYKRVNRHVPWGFRQNRCYRTLKNLGLPGEELNREGTFHNALDDAKHQARNAVVWLRNLNNMTFR